MTDSKPFSTLLRELSRAASPAPWFGGHLSDPPAGCDCTYILNEHRCGSIATFSVAKEGDEYAAEYPTKAECIANMALTTSLRNDAEKYADLRDAVEAYRVAVRLCAMESDMELLRTWEKERDAARRTMFAALAALGGEE